MIQKIIMKRNPFDENTFSSKARYYTLVQKKANRIKKNIIETVLGIILGIITALVIYGAIIYSSEGSTYVSNGKDAYGNDIIIDGVNYHEE